MPYLVVFGIAGLVLAIINLHTKCKTLVPPVGMSTKILKKCGDIGFYHLYQY